MFGGGIKETIAIYRLRREEGGCKFRTPFWISTKLDSRALGYEANFFQPQKTKKMSRYLMTLCKLSFSLKKLIYVLNIKRS